MVTVKAIFDGENIILPESLQLRGRGEIEVSIPEEMIVPTVKNLPKSTSNVPAKSIWDFLNDGYRSGRTMDDVDRQLREDRDSWGDPHDRVRGDE